MSHPNPRASTFLIRTCLRRTLPGRVFTKATPQPWFFVGPAPSQIEVANLDSAGVLDEDRGPQAGLDRGASPAVAPDDDGPARRPGVVRAQDEVSRKGLPPGEEEPVARPEVMVVRAIDGPPGLLGGRARVIVAALGVDVIGGTGIGGLPLARSGPTRSAIRPKTIR